MTTKHIAQILAVLNEGHEIEMTLEDYGITVEQVEAIPDHFDLDAQYDSDDGGENNGSQHFIMGDNGQWAFFLRFI